MMLAEERGEGCPHSCALCLLKCWVCEVGVIVIDVDMYHFDDKLRIREHEVFFALQFLVNNI